jgi:DNA-binding Xre family transcriptional regulator
MIASTVIRLRIAELLAESGMTQTELAERTGLPRTNINKMVNHPEKIKQIGFGTLEALCSVFGVQTNRVVEYLPDAD